MAMFIRTLLETKGQQAGRLGPEATVAEVADLLALKHVDMVVITDRVGMILGVVTASDVIRTVASCSAHQHACVTRVVEMMTRNVIACGFKDDVEQIWFVMKERGLRHMPVVDEAGKLAGLIERRDVLLSLYEETKLEESELQAYVLGVGYH
jgi:CBS domain-containing protein